MVRPLAVLGLTLALLPIASAAVADDAAAKKLITQLYASMDANYKKKDLKSFLSKLAPNFTAIRSNGQKVNRAQFEQMTRQGIEPDQVTVKNCVNTIKKIELHGGKATVEVLGKVELTLRGQDGKTHVVASSGASRDTLVKKNGAWLIAETRETGAQSATMDGKAIKTPQVAPVQPSRTTK